MVQHEKDSECRTMPEQLPEQSKEKGGMHILLGFYKLAIS